MTVPFVVVRSGPDSGADLAVGLHRALAPRWRRALDAAMPTLSVRVLGDLDVQDVDLAVLGSRKARTLVWLLALARGLG
jgi:hypothetical protein